MSMDKKLDIAMEKARSKTEAPTYSYQIDVVGRWGKPRTVETFTNEAPWTRKQAGDYAEKYADFGKAVVVNDDPHALTWGPPRNGRVRTEVLFCKQDESHFAYLWA